MLESSVVSEQEEAAKQGKQQSSGGDKMPPTSHTLIDLVIAMAIYLPRTSFATLFAMAAAILNGQTGDQQLIKKAYKLIPRLATTESGTAALQERSSELQTLILTTADKTPPSARRDRMLAIHELVTYLPNSDLHFIPSVLSEVVLGCKESNEKARTASFDLLVHLAKRTIDNNNPPDTKIRNALVPHMPDDTPDAAATIEEFFTMASAGLAGTSPHMVAASVTALSRLFFDFHTQLPPSVRSDLVQTVELFLTSNNREIVRSVLGFVKVAVVVLPDDALRARLDSLVPNLMAWNKEHKGRLRSKVKGILDRLIRRFGAPLIESLVGEADRKLVVNIRKQRERSKKKKKAGEEGNDDDDDNENETTGTKPAAGATAKSFDKALDDNDSDLSDSDLDSDDSASEIDIDEQGTLHPHHKKPAAGGSSKKNANKQQNEQYIREGSPEDNPLDLLGANALANISTTKPSVRFLNTGPGAKRKQRHAKVDPDGRLIFGDDDDDNAGGAGDNKDDGGTGGVNAYLAAVSGPDAARRGQKGKIKMSQGQSKKSRNGGDGMDIDDDGDDLKEDFKAAKAGGGRGRGGRRGLGEVKSHGPSIGGGRVQKRGNGGGFKRPQPGRGGRGGGGGGGGRGMARGGGRGGGRGR